MNEWSWILRYIQNDEVRIKQAKQVMHLNVRSSDDKLDDNFFNDHFFIGQRIWYKLKILDEWRKFKIDLMNARS